jgi:FkbM family methyltransferase
LYLVREEVEMTSIVLFGAGTTGRVIARDLNAKGNPPLCFVDNDPKKWGEVMEGVAVVSPDAAKKHFPNATWIVSVMRPERAEIALQLEIMKVKTGAMWEFLPKRHNIPTLRAQITVENLIHDEQSIEFWNDQMRFRRNPEEPQIPQSSIDNIYFEDFITQRDDEHYVDCGAADGDTAREFMKWSPQWSRITAFEPDLDNFKKLSAVDAGIHCYGDAIGDHDHMVRFKATKDYSSHVDSKGDESVLCVALDGLNIPIPTFIKMDIEGSELEALWGARRIIKEHSPVLAICAYHEAEHLWEIPLLIHALNPEYELFLRRYAESTFELVWYAVPKGRVK